MLDTCPRCATIALDLPVTCPECGYPLVLPPSGTTATGHQRRPLAVAATLIAGFAALVMIITLTSDDGEVMFVEGIRTPLAAPIESEPEEVWRWSSGHGIDLAEATETGELLVTVDDGTTVLVDGSGEPKWTVEAQGDFAGQVPGSDVIVIGELPERSVAREDVEPSMFRLTAYAIETGKELWQRRGRVLVGLVGDALAVLELGTARTAGELRIIDPETAETKWAVPRPDTLAATTDALYVLRGKELTALDTDSGDEQWTVTLDLESRTEQQGWLGELAATERFVMVAGSEVVGLAAEDGDELWREGGRGRDASARIGRLGERRTYVSWTGPDPKTGSLDVFDRRGLDGTISTTDEGYATPFNPVVFETDGDEFVVDRKSVV